MDNKYATKYPMDIPHVIAVELPLNVKDNDRAIAMLGGKERIKMASNASYRPSVIQGLGHSLDDRKLELRLRNDPFHHPVQATVNKREKILMKVSVPKQSLPADYYENPNKYSIRDLIAMNKDKSGPSHKVEPVSIVNKNFCFRGIADFQMTTKNNRTVQDFNKDVLKSNDFEDTKKFYGAHLINKDEFRDSSIYENKDHQLVPPPYFSGARFPFDYKYRKNQVTMAIRDENGDMKVVMKVDGQKLFASTVDYHKGQIPEQPLPEIIKKRKWLETTDLSQQFTEKRLLECIKLLEELFELKPVWLRKMLLDVVPEPLKSSVKIALPHVSYCFKNGPWRFCIVKFGVDPTSDRSFWMFQSEYFRLSLRNQGPKQAVASSATKVTPNTISQFYPSSTVHVSENLLFTGMKLPATINYQLGDIVDKDVQRVIQEARGRGDNAFFRDFPDGQDGWVTRQMMGTIRGIIRYKLSKLNREEPVEAGVLAKIINTDYTLKDASKNEEDGEGDDGDGDDADALSGDDDEEDDDDDDDEEALNEPDDNDEDNVDVEETDSPLPKDVADITEEYVLTRVRQVDARTAEKLSSLVGLIKQDTLNKNGSKIN